MPGSVKFYGEESADPLGVQELPDLQAAVMADVPGGGGAGGRDRAGPAGAPVSGIEATQGAQAVDRAAALLRLITAAEEPLTYTQLHARSGLSRSTVSRLLLALERNELVRRDGRMFRPGLLIKFSRYTTEEQPDGTLILTPRA